MKEMGTSWVLNERINLMGCDGGDKILSALIICDEQGEAFTPIWKSEVSFNGQNSCCCKQANFDWAYAFTIWAHVVKPEFSYDIAQVISKNLLNSISINSLFFVNPSFARRKEFFSLSKKQLPGERGLSFDYVSSQLREKGLERFIDPVQKLYQKVWDFLLIDEQGRCGKTYPAYVK